MHLFRCPACDRRTIHIVRKWTASAVDPAVCPACQAAVCASPRHSSMWRTVEALLVTLVVVRALIDFDWGLIAVMFLIIFIMEGLRLVSVPLVKREPRGDGFG